MSQAEFQPSGLPEVDEAVAAVAALEDGDPAAHVEVFEAAHRALRTALSSQG